jgi:flagella basal body P-ring formation protein FlgA
VIRRAVLGCVLVACARVGDASAIVTTDRAPAATSAVAPAASAAVLARPVGRGRVLAAADLVPNGDGTPREVPEALRGLRTRAHLSPGRTVTTADMESPPLVERNQEVTVFVRRAGLLVSLQGRALDEGRLGEHVKVLNRVAGRTVGGVVVGAGLVEVPLS